MDIFRISSQHPINKRYWTFCGDDYGYNLFKDKKPKEVAIDVINTVLNGQEIDTMKVIDLFSLMLGMNGEKEHI